MKTNGISELVKKHVSIAAETKAKATAITIEDKAPLLEPGLNFIKINRVVVTPESVTIRYNIVVEKADGVWNIGDADTYVKTPTQNAKTRERYGILDFKDDVAEVLKLPLTDSLFENFSAYDIANCKHYGEAHDKYFMYKCQNVWKPQAEKEDRKLGDYIKEAQQDVGYMHYPFIELAEGNTTCVIDAAEDNIIVPVWAGLGKSGKAWMNIKPYQVCKKLCETLPDVDIEDVDVDTFYEGLIEDVKASIK